ncbi:MAG: exodeoxyribonuclease VII large subunit [Candidatus Zapsychrus exili]|nr:exodeoxyribonuclease VII large subunit [Candidatus Zapsychrus exili]
MDKEFLTVSELNNLIKDVINMGFPQSLWVCGEIQQYNRSKNKKHVFFQLVEKDQGTNDTKACIDLVIWASRRPYIEEILKKSENAFSLKDDIEVKFACKVDFYPPHGRVRLSVESIDPVYTLGKIAQEKRKLIALLQEKGILDKNKQLDAPVVPLNIGLITSGDSAAYNDFLSELKKSGFGFKVYFKNALMQGKNAEKDVCKALGALNKVKNLDAIVVTRGGGSISDLSCFDSQVIAEKIASLKIPVLSGIGHEIDMSVTDLAAHSFFKTPTAVAQYLVGLTEEYLIDIDQILEEIINISQQRIAEDKGKLKNLAAKLEANTNRYLKEHNAEIIRIIELFKHRPEVLLKDFRNIIDTKKDCLMKVVISRLKNDKKNIIGFQKLVDALDPVNTLKRGFSVTRDKDGKIIKSIKSAKEQDDISTETADGFLTSRIINIKTGGQNG